MSLQQGHELVAVPDPAATSSDGAVRYRLGMRPNRDDAVFEIGSTGPNGQTFPWIVAKGGNATYEIDLLDGELTVTTRVGEEANVQAVVYKIDVEAMTGQKMRKGEPVRIVFAYEQRLADGTTPLDEWVATTGPRYVEELHTRLGQLDTSIADMQADIDEAKENGRFGLASRAPRSAVPLHIYDQQKELAEAEARMSQAALAADEAVLEDEAIDLTEPEIEIEDPEPVIVPDPNSGARYVGRRWKRRRRTTLRHLKDASYRVAVLVLHNGESATIVLQHPKDLPAIQMTSKHGIVRQYLEESAWDVVLAPGEKVTFDVHSPMEGDREIPRGYLSTAVVEEIVATGPHAKEGVDYPKSDALARFREREEELRNGRPLGRNLVA